MEKSRKQLRKEIDLLDRKLIQCLSSRMAVTRQIALVKKKMGLAIKSPAREAEIISSRKSFARRHGLNPKFVEALFKDILKESRRVQGQKRKE